MDHDLVAERALLEQQIAALQESIVVMGARLDIERAAGVRPRGLVVGLVIGALFVVAFIGLGVLMALSTVGRMD